MLLCSTFGWIHLSHREAGALVSLEPCRARLTVTLFLGALPWGPSGVAAAWSISYWTLLIPGFWYAGRPIGFGISPLIPLSGDTLPQRWWRACNCRDDSRYGIVVPPFTHERCTRAIILISMLFITVYLGTIIVFTGAWRRCVS